MKFKKIVLAAIVFCTTSAFAADKSTNFYAGLDAGSSNVKNYSGRMLSVGGFVAYQFTDDLAIEGGYRRLANLDFFAENVNLTQSSLSLVGKTALGGGFDLFGRVGYNKLDADVSRWGRKSAVSESGSYLGVGFAYNVNSSFTLRLEAQRPSSDSTNVSAAMLWKF